MHEADIHRDPVGWAKAHGPKAPRRRRQCFWGTQFPCNSSCKTAGACQPAEALREWKALEVEWKQEMAAHRSRDGGDDTPAERNDS